jgi:hypothetical protein
MAIKVDSFIILLTKGFNDKEVGQYGGSLSDLL